MRFPITVTVAAALLAATASAQTQPPAEAPSAVTAPAAESVAKPPPAMEVAAAKEAAPARKAAKAEGFVLTVGDDSLQLYGIIDATVGTADNVTPDGGRLTGFRTAWFSGNRWGLKVKHVVSDDLSIIGKLESEYLVADGSMDTPNVLFNRDAWVGFDSKLVGQITIGRQNTLARDFSQTYGDPYGSAGVRMDEGGWTNTNNFKQMIYYAGSGGGTRLDRNFVLKKKVGDFMIGAAYAMGNQADQFSKNGTGSIGLGWNGGLYNVSGFYTQSNVDNKVHRAWSIGGNVQPIKLVRVNAGVFGYSAEQNATLGDRSDIAFTISTKITPAPEYDLELGYQSMRAKDAAQTGTGAAANTLNAFKDASAATVKGTGNRNTIYASVFYHLDSKAEVYVAGDYLTLTGDYQVAGTNGHRHQTEIVTGLRYKF